MKKLIALLLSCTLLIGCTPPGESAPTAGTTASSHIESGIDEEKMPEFSRLNDPDLLTYVEDNIYSNLVAEFASEDYIIENVSAIYVSQEYLDEVAFNSQSNVYFGYTLENLDAQFQGKRYVFTLGENGETTVKAFESYDDTYDQALKNVAIGTGLIFVCITVSVISGGVGTPPAVTMIFSSAAKTGAAYALSSGALSSVAAATITGIQTGDWEEAKKAAILAGSESFKWGAITGVITGGAGEALKLYRSSRTQPTWQESEQTVLKRTNNAEKQIAYIDGKQVAYNTNTATRPDVVVKNKNGTVHAIEVKNYNLAEKNNRSVLLDSLEHEIADRNKHLPSGSTQEIVLDVRGRNFSKDVINNAKTEILERLKDIYPNIPITILSY